MAVQNYKELKTHLFHRVRIVAYGKPEVPQNVAIECEECQEVLLDFDKD